ncbi:MAG TPA: hypothetical protein PK373_05310, partial [Sedimentisphaerales bacterium]|nr:hypothetical protein [Sedimentisphaerales bacterium]
MKDLLIQTAKRTGLLDAEQLARYLDENQGRGRVDEILLTCPFYTEDVVLKLFAEALDWQYLPEISDQQVPSEFIQNVPATYAQHHHLVGVKSGQDDGE